MSKRSSPDAEEDSECSSKRTRRVIFEPVKLPAVSTVSEMDHHVLVFQHRKLQEQLFKHQRIENDLRRRIEQLERRQTQDDAMLCIINRHWNRLDEDVRILLQRFDAETAVEMETENESPSTSSFITQLSQWDKNEVNDRLSQRVEFSRRAIGKLVQAFDRITQRNERITERLKELKGGDDAEGNRPESDQLVDKALLNEAVMSLNGEVQEENTRLQNQVTKLQHKNHVLSMENSKLEEKLSAAETAVQEMENKVEEAQYAIDKAEAREDKLDYRLQELGKQHQALELQLATSTTSRVVKTEADGDKEYSEVSKTKLEELQLELDEQIELATNRLSELRELTDKHKSDLQEVEKLKSDLRYLPEHVIINSTEYKLLQSQFSVLFNELMQVRNMYEEARIQLITAKTAHLKQIEQMEQEELLAQKQLRSEMVLLEDQTSQVRREYEMLRLEFEQNLAAHEQSGPVTKEMRQLLASYKTQNQQLKAEIARFKKKWRECISLLTKTQRELEEERRRLEQAIFIPKIENDTPLSPAADTPESCQLPVIVKYEVPHETESILDDFETVESLETLRSMIRALKSKLQLTQSSQNPSEKSANDSKTEELQKEISSLKESLRKMSEAEKLVRKQLVGEETARKIKHLEEQAEQLKRDFTNCKQEENALLSEMEVTGQAFEDMQEQNARLVLQLREKDDANFKLMSERIRSNQQFKLLREEKGLVEQQVVALQNQVEAQNLVVRKLEDKERLLQNNLATVEKELNLRQQALELHKRKALESAQSAADLKLQLEKLQAQLNDASAAVSEKTATIEEESFKVNRLQEEISMLKKKLERSKKMEKADTADEVLLEEIRDLKSQLTCSCCRVNKKNAILLKCSHVFCFDCLKTRYETRQRKCPKCNGQFGPNDYRRMFF